VRPVTFSGFAWGRRQRRADILVAEVGRPRVISGAMVKPGAVVMAIRGGLTTGTRKACGMALPTAWRRGR